MIGAGRVTGRVWRACSLGTRGWSLTQETQRGRRLEEEQPVYKSVRNSDHIMGVPFECDFCHFSNMTQSSPGTLITTCQGLLDAT